MKKMSKNNELHSQKLNRCSKYKSGGIRYLIHLKRYLKSIFQTFLKQIYRFGQLAFPQVGGWFTNKSAFGTKKAQADVLQYGRSMIEMLGVLAIIGVLSVGGIAGYTKAMETYKINRLIGQYNEIIYGILEKGYAAWAPNGKMYTIQKSELEALNLFPEDWSRYYGTDYLTDSLKNLVALQNRLTYITLDIHIGESGAEVFNTKMCREIFNKFAKPNAKILRQTGIWRGTSEDHPNASSTEHYYGDSLCRDGKKCIRDMTPVVVDNLCKTGCLEKSSCIIFLYFLWPF